MQNQQFKLLVIRKEDEYAPSIDYVFRLFGRNQGAKVTLSSEYSWAGTDKAEGPAAVALYSASNDDFEAEAFHHLPNMRIERSPFFGPGFTKSPGLPEQSENLRRASEANGFRNLVSRNGGQFVLGFDLIAAAFWFLSRYEEYVDPKTDDHGRFLCAYSAAPRELYDQPLVNLWFERLGELLRDVVKLPQAPPLRTTIALTHDVDLLRKYRSVRSVARSAMAAATGKVSIAETREAAMVLAGVRRDPYDCFDELFDLKEKLAAPSTFFLMSGGNAQLDGDYRLTDLPARELVTKITRSGDKIALHASYESGFADGMIAEERKAMTAAIGRDPHGARQHYLRFETPQTWKRQIEAGIQYDSTGGFADYAGFKFGWSGCFRPFDVKERKELPIVEIPLIAMDVTFAVYEKLASEIALERLSNLVEASAVRGGAFVLLWHNIMGDQRAFPGYWDTLEYLLFAAAGSARFVTLRQLIDEFNG